MAKKKSSKRLKNQRRRKELLRAQGRNVAKENIIGASVSTTKKTKKAKKVTHKLHVKEIRTDLVKTTIFVIFAIILLAVIKEQGLQLNL